MSSVSWLSLEAVVSLLLVGKKFLSNDDCDCRSRAFFARYSANCASIGRFHFSFQAPRQMLNTQSSLNTAKYRKNNLMRDFSPISYAVTSLKAEQIERDCKERQLCMGDTYFPSFLSCIYLCTTVLFTCCCCFGCVCMGMGRGGVISSNEK